MGWASYFEDVVDKATELCHALSSIRGPAGGSSPTTPSAAGTGEAGPPGDVLPAAGKSPKVPWTAARSSTPAQKLKVIRGEFCSVALNDSETGAEAPPRARPKLPTKDIGRFFRLLSRECDKMMKTLEGGREKGWGDTLRSATAVVEQWLEQPQNKHPPASLSNAELHLWWLQCNQGKDNPEARRHFEEVRRLLDHLEDMAQDLRDHLCFIDTYLGRLTNVPADTKKQYAEATDKVHDCRACFGTIMFLWRALDDYVFFEFPDSWQCDSEAWERTRIERPWFLELVDRMFDAQGPAATEVLRHVGLLSKSGSTHQECEQERKGGK
jgi:hypothetical protein